MPATPRAITFTREDLDAAARSAIRRSSGDAVPVFGDNDQYPRIWDINDLLHRPRAQWLVGNMVEEKGLTVFFGPDKVGKTAALSNVLWAWTAGHTSFLDPDITLLGPDERRVLYVLLEGQANFYDRYDAWCHAYNSGEHLDGFYVMDEGLSLFQQRMEWEDPSTWTPSARKLWNAIDAIRPHILVIDTLSRATAGMDENSSSMAHVVGMLDNIRDVYDVSTVIVHHTSLADGDRPRGHSSLKGAASSYVRIEGKPEDPVLKLRTGPHRNSDVYLTIPFKRSHERASFVIETVAERDLWSIKDQIADAVQGGEWNRDALVEQFYGDVNRENRRKLLDRVREHPNLEYAEGFVRYVEADEVEEL